MKTLEFTDAELKEFRKILNWVIPYRLNDYYMKRPDEEKKTILGQVNTYMKMYNKCICSIYDIEDSEQAEKENDTIEFSDLELNELRKLLNWVYSECWNNYVVLPNKEDKIQNKREANEIAKMHNKFINPTYEILDEDEINRVD